MKIEIVLGDRSEHADELIRLVAKSIADHILYDRDGPFTPHDKTLKEAVFAYIAACYDPDTIAKEVGARMKIFKHDPAGQRIVKHWVHEAIDEQIRAAVKAAVPDISRAAVAAAAQLGAVAP